MTDNSSITRRTVLAGIGAAGASSGIVSASQRENESKTPPATKNAVVRNSRKNPVSGEVKIQHGKGRKKMRAEFSLESPIGPKGTSPNFKKKVHIPGLAGRYTIIVKVDGDTVEKSYPIAKGSKNRALLDITITSRK